MAFNKVVKAPAKLAHIRNYPHKKTEAEVRRMHWLLQYIDDLSEALVLPGKLNEKLFFYSQLRDAVKEINRLPCYNGVDVQEIFVRVRFYHERRMKW